MIKLKSVTLSYPGATAVEKLTGAFKSNTMTAIIGPNGGGKSSLIKGIMGILPLDSGEIKFQTIRQKELAYLPQQSRVDRTFPLNVFDVVSMGLSQKQGFFRKINQTDLIEATLEKVGLQGYKDKSIQALSGGQFQKVLFARLWLQEAKVILLDEPFTGIDRHTTEDIIQILKMWVEEGKTIIAVLHHFDLVRDHFPETLLLARRLIAWGETKTVLTRENLEKAIEQSRFWESGTESSDLASQTSLLAVPTLEDS